MHTPTKFFLQYIIVASCYKFYQQCFEILLNYKKLEEFIALKREKINKQMKFTAEEVIIPIRLRQQPVPLA